MTQSLNSGVTGMRAHQRMLDAIGNNIANVNTTAYKSGQVLFSDLVYQSLRPATGPTATGGGTNPSQLGYGVQVAQLSRNTTQGDLELTGKELDFGISGDGFFTVRNGEQTLYTRAGSFALDSAGRLVDPATGFLVQRFGTTGEASAANPGFQTPGDSSIQVPLGALLPGMQTSTLSLSGNLPATATAALQEVLSTSTPLTQGGAPAAAGDLLNSLDSIVTPYNIGDQIEISGLGVDGSAVSSTLAVDGTTTLQNLLDAISAAYAGATASLDGSGNLLLTADTGGPASASLNLADAAGNAGQFDFGNHAVGVAIDGKAADQFQTAVEVFDERGGSHSLNLSFTKSAANAWDLEATLDPADGVVLDGSVQQIVFNNDGSIQMAGSPGLGDINLSFQFAGLATTQTTSVGFGAANSFNGLTQLASTARLTSNQDGFPPGSLASVSVDPAGTLHGITSNGRSFELAQLAIASFRNPQGLMQEGGNYLAESNNSGTPTIGASVTSIIRGGQLESSNVDIAGEFTQMIIAQRGFSANARTITVSNEILQELLSIVR